MLVADIVELELEVTEVIEVVVAISTVYSSEKNWKTGSESCKKMSSTRQAKIHLLAKSVTASMETAIWAPS